MIKKAVATITATNGVSKRDLPDLSGNKSGGFPRGAVVNLDISLGDPANDICWVDNDGYRWVRVKAEVAGLPSIYFAIGRSDLSETYATLDVTFDEPQPEPEPEPEPPDNLSSRGQMLFLAIDSAYNGLSLRFAPSDGVPGQVEFFVLVPDGEVPASEPLWVGSFDPAIVTTVFAGALYERVYPDDYWDVRFPAPEPSPPGEEGD